MRYYIRWGTCPRYSQDQPTYIMIGNWTHLYNTYYKIWFVVDSVPDKHLSLNRTETNMISVKWSEVIRACGPRAWLERIEDPLGVRFCYIAGHLLRKHKWLRKFKFLRRLANIDINQDYSMYSRHAEPPRFDFNGGEAL